ncbi:MAG: transposase [Gloeobacteraceae cyanobacterium ES-bin-144]|nr:transposase [Verrucomicrobiales bacterium]
MSEFYHPEHETQKHGDKLPHWQQGDVIQFVTFRLADSMPQTKLRIWKEELEVWNQHNPKPWSEKQTQQYHTRFTCKLEHWLDECSGSCVLNDPANRLILEKILMNDHGTRATHHAWAIMPNHVHLLFTPLAPLDKLMQSWKGISSRKIGLGSIWQENYRDTLIRDAQHFANTIRYIRRNPVKLKPNTFTLWQSERALAI